MAIANRRGDVAPQRVVLLRAEAMPPGAVALTSWAAALAAMQPTDPPALHRRLPARPMIMPAAGLAARRLGKPKVFGVANRQHCAGHRVGVASGGFCPGPLPQGGQIEPLRGR